MNSHSGKDQKGNNQSIANNVTPQNKKNADVSFTDNRPEAIAQRKLNAIQLQAKASVPSQQEAMPAADPDAPVQRVELFPSHNYGNGRIEPQIKTSGNFDTNHLVQGESTEEIAEQRLTTRGTTLNTIVSFDALKREIGNNDLDLINRVGTQNVTQYGNFAGNEAKIASSGGVLNAPSIGLMSRRQGPNAIEIHHLHEAEQKLDTASTELFPALPSKKPPAKSAPRSERKS